MSLESATRRIDALADQHVNRRAQELRTDIVETLSQPGTGRVYGQHQASAPGEAPTVNTGRLRQAVNVQKVADGHYTVGSGRVEYADDLEFGTRTIAPRPAWRPAIEAFKQKL